MDRVVPTTLVRTTSGLRAYISLHLHPLFVDGRASGHTSLQTLLNQVPNPVIHRMLHINHRSIEDMEGLDATSKYMGRGEGETHCFWQGRLTRMDIIEVDEATNLPVHRSEGPKDDEHQKPVVFSRGNNGVSLWCGLGRTLLLQIAAKDVCQKSTWPRSCSKDRMDTHGQKASPNISKEF